MFLIGAIKPNSRKEIQKLFFFTRLFSVDELRANKVNPVLFLYTAAVGFLAETKTFIKIKEKTNCHQFYYIITLSKYFTRQIFE